MWFPTYNASDNEHVIGSACKDPVREVIGALTKSLGKPAVAGALKRQNVDVSQVAGDLLEGWVFSTAFLHAHAHCFLLVLSGQEAWRVQLCYMGMHTCTPYPLCSLRSGGLKGSALLHGHAHLTRFVLLGQEAWGLVFYTALVFMHLVSVVDWADVVMQRWWCWCTFKCWIDSVIL